MPDLNNLLHLEEWRRKIDSTPQENGEERKELEREFYRETVSPRRMSFDYGIIELAAVLWKSLGCGLPCGYEKIYEWREKLHHRFALKYLNLWRDI